MTDTLFALDSTDRLQEAVEELWKVPGWPVDEGKDRKLVAELADIYPGLDLTREIARWRDWLVGKGMDGTDGRPRGKVRTYFQRRSADAHQRSGRAGVRQRTQARGARAFAGEADRLEGW